MTQTRIANTTGEGRAPAALDTNNNAQTATAVAASAATPPLPASDNEPLDLGAIKVSYQEGVLGDLRRFSLGGFLNWIEQGRYREQVDSIRTGYARLFEETGDEKQAKKGVADLKKVLPAITPSGLFEGGRKMENLRQYTGVICYDIDGCDPGPVMAAAPNCPYALAAFASPTGTGVKLFIDVGASAGVSDHPALWQAGKRMVKKYFGVDVDESRKDVTGLCFISAGEVYRNERAVPVKLAALLLSRRFRPSYWACWWSRRALAKCKSSPTTTRRC